MLGRADTFKGGDGGPVFNAFHFQRTGTYQLAVQNHITGTALTRAASDLRWSAEAVRTQHVGQRIFRIHQQRFRHAILNESLGNHVPLLDSTASPPDGPNRRVSGYRAKETVPFRRFPSTCDEYIQKPILPPRSYGSVQKRLPMTCTYPALLGRADMFICAYKKPCILSMRSPEKHWYCLRKQP